MAAAPTGPLVTLKVGDPPAQTETAGQASQDNRYRFIFGLFVVGAYLSLAWWWSYRPPALPGDVVGQVLGNLGMLVGLVVGYWFSTSSGSTLKSLYVSQGKQP